tara:strand:+ start:259 stop:486 length:228 start_codon:yes stop_codon:yes gene_type:complete
VPPNGYILKSDINNEIEKRHTTKLNNFFLPLNTINNDPKKRGIEKYVGKLENPKFVGFDSLNKLTVEKYNHLKTR